MRKIILLAAIAVIAATAAVWSIVTFANPKAAFHVQSTEELAPVSPHEIMTHRWRGQRNVNWFTQRGRRKRYRHHHARSRSPIRFVGSAAPGGGDPDNRAGPRDLGALPHRMIFQAGADHEIRSARHLS